GSSLHAVRARPTSVGNDVARGFSARERFLARIPPEVNMQAFPYEDRGAGRLALGLGWFSIGLGVAEVAAPRAMARLSGLRDDESAESIVRSLGAREIAH